MKMYSMIALVFALVATAQAEQNYAFGLSGSVVNPQRDTVTTWLLEQQRKTPVADQSELTAPLYVESQKRISDTFRKGIPDSLTDRANSQKSSN